MSYLTPSFNRLLANIRQAGWKQAWRDYQYIGEPKFGKLVGQDEHGNKYYENMNETLWRHRWVDYASHDYNASQVSSEWHAWMQHTRHEPPTSDIVLQQAKKSWQIPHFENLTGTRGAYKPYSTTKHKVATWDPTVSARP